MRTVRQPPHVAPEPFDPEWTPYNNLASSVIKQAAGDFLARNVNLRRSARDFFFSDTGGNVVMREHWFAQAGMTIRDRAALVAGLAAARLRGRLRDESPEAES